MISNTIRTPTLLVLAALLLLSTAAKAVHVSFERGDIFISLEPGAIQWRLPDGTLRQTLVPTVAGYGEGMAFDASGNLYVARWRADSMGFTGNTVEKYDVLGRSEGAVGHGYNCDPHTIVFQPNGVAYVGQAGCRRSILKFTPGTVAPTEYMVGEDNQGVFWMDLASDGCTMFYTSYGPNVKRFDVCTNTQLADFNAAPLPGGVGHDLRILPDGGVLVSSGEVVARLDAFGVLSRTYQGPAEPTLFAGLDLGFDDTFIAGNYRTSNVYTFDLATGAIVRSFNAGTPANSLVGVRIMK
jgi:hypothetical protein